jgi:hypothetical protein
MSRISYLLPIALLAGLLVGLAPQPAAAAGMPGQHGISCQDGVCTLTLDLNGDGETAETAGLLRFALPQDMGVIPAGSSIELSDDLLLRLPVGDFRLDNASLTLQLDEDNQVQRLRGTTTLPGLDFPGAEGSSTPIVADIGLDLGKNLDVDAALDPDRSYLFLDVGPGFELATGSETENGREQPFRLVVPEGKQATLIIDPQEPFVYLSGDFDVHTNGELFLLRQALDPSALPLPLDALPVGQHAALHVTGALGRDLDKARLELGAGYAIDEGIVGNWIDLDATPLSVEGLVTLTPDGMLLSGLTRSSIQPDLIFDGELQTEAFIPFAEVLDNVYVQLDGSAAIPLANIDMQKTARLDTDKVIAWVEPVEGIVAEWVAAMPAIDWNAPALLAQARSASEQGIGWASGAAVGTYQSLADRVNTSEF